MKSSAYCETDTTQPLPLPRAARLPRQRPPQAVPPSCPPSPSPTSDSSTSSRQTQSRLQAAPQQNEEFDPSSLERDLGLRRSMLDFLVEQRDAIRRAYVKLGPYQPIPSRTSIYLDKNGRRFFLLLVQTLSKLARVFANKKWGILSSLLSFGCVSVVGIDKKINEL